MENLSISSEYSYNDREKESQSHLKVTDRQDILQDIVQLPTNPCSNTEVTARIKEKHNADSLLMAHFLYVTGAFVCHTDNTREV